MIHPQKPKIVYALSRYVFETFLGNKNDRNNVIGMRGDVKKSWVSFWVLKMRNFPTHLSLKHKYTCTNLKLICIVICEASPE